MENKRGIVVISLMISHHLSKKNGEKGASKNDIPGLKGEWW